MGGGGQSGTIAFPAYLETTHRYLLNGDSVSFATPNKHLIGILNTAWAAGNNPYATFNFTDPVAEYTAMKERLLYFDTRVKALQYKEDWKAILDYAIMYSRAGLIDIDATGIKEDSADDGAGSVSRAKAAITTALAAENPEVSLGSYLANALTVISEENAVERVDAATILTEALIGAATTFTQAKISADIGLDEDSDWQRLLDVVSTRLTQFLAIRPDIDVASIIEAAQTEAETQTRTAMGLAAEMVNDNELDSLIASYTSRSAYEFQRGVNAFTAGMADVNAVHTSSFVIGFALMQAQRATDIAEFSARISLDNYQGNVQAYLGAVATNAQLRAGVSAQNAEARGAYMQDALQSMVGMLVNKSQITQGMAGLFLDTDRGQTAPRLEAASTNAQNANGLLAQMVQNTISLAENKRTMEQALLSVFQQTFGTMVENRLRAEGINKQAKDTALATATQTMMQGLYNNLALDKDAAAMTAEIGRQAYVMRKEYEESDLEKDVMMATWDADRLLQGSNILSALTGSSGYIPNKPGRAASAIGGAMTGAVGGATAGAAIGAAGGPIGAVGGAGIGAVLGAIGGLF